MLLLIVVCLFSTSFAFTPNFHVLGSSLSRTRLCSFPQYVHRSRRDKLHNSNKGDSEIDCAGHSSGIVSKTNKPSSATIMATGTKRGAFILFEGIDRCGKSTQCTKLAEYLASRYTAEKINFPDRTSSIGQMINSYLTSATNLNDQTIHLLFSANRWEAAKNIETKLSTGCHLVCDRYAYSGVAFSSAKGMDVEWCKSCDKGLPAPDVIIYLDMPVEDAAKRGQFGEERYEKIEFQLKVREKFMDLQEADRGTLNWHTIDARKTIEEIHAEISTIAESTIREVGDKDVSRLWM